MHMEAKGLGYCFLGNNSFFLFETKSPTGLEIAMPVRVRMVGQ